MRTPIERVLVLGRSAEDVAKMIRAEAPGLHVAAKSLEEARPADVVAAEAVLAFKVPEQLHGHLGGLRWIQSTGAGVDFLLACPGLARTAPLTRIVGAFNVRMAEYVLARVLALAQGVPRLFRDQAARRWEPFDPRTLAQLSVLVVGVGEIGAAIAVKLAGNGARVRGVNRTGRPVEGVPDVYPIGRLTELLPAADVLVLAAPSTRRTQQLIGARELSLLRPGGFVVNVARGALLDEAALLAVLDSGHLAGAALDVFATEPLPADSGLWSREGVMISPHVAGLTTPAEAAAAFVDNWRRWNAGLPLRGLVDRGAGY